MEFIMGDVRVVWEDIGEGKCEQYNPNDPDDVAYLRFYVDRAVRDEHGDIIDWEDVENGSYCTQVPANTPDPILNKLLKVLMERFYDDVVEGKSIKKLGQEMSWIDPSWAKYVSDKELLTADQVANAISECISEIVEGEALAELFNLVCSGTVEYKEDGFFEFTPPEGG
jgi:hypothetical protein